MRGVFVDFFKEWGIYIFPTGHTAETLREPHREKYEVGRVKSRKREKWEGVRNGEGKKGALK